MSSGYSSLEEDSEEYFFTARTSLFKKPSVKPTNLKVNMYDICIYLNQFIYFFWKLTCHIVFVSRWDQLFLWIYSNIFHNNCFDLIINQILI